MGPSGRRRGGARTREGAFGTGCDERASERVSRGVPGRFHSGAFMPYLCNKSFCLGCFICHRRLLLAPHPPKAESWENPLLRFPMRPGVSSRGCGQPRRQRPTGPRLLVPGQWSQGTRTPCGRGGLAGGSLCSGPSPELGGLRASSLACWVAPCSQICTVGREPRSSRSTWGPGKLRARADGGPLEPPRRSSKKGPSLASGPGQGGSPGRAVPGAQLTEPSVQHGGRHGQQALRSRDLAAPSAPTSPGRDGRAHGEASGRQSHRSGTGFLTGRARVLPRGPGPSGPATGLPQQLPGRPQAPVPKERRLR